ncbi:PepSY domain-containing protein [Rhizobiaceae bacterium n13]|uniref:PepSY domain-containing protein n=1 Tax=Ferirhizobium litorale TaxID=2927786 RepID=A0AAE3QAV9_9HYPH|nr:PepSY domain-containing protein [Fererhizobium litorale]MDI7862329.1 PepSY domain-containing protein [Fererhizobium litorale]MDI7922397.1 PepSY domain-containing protein [Fererhizobium litorale]
MLNKPTDTSIPAGEGALARTFYTTAWRWHFYAGLYVAPFLIMLAVTGLIMLWSSVLVGRDGEKLYSVEPAKQTVALSAQANAAVAAVPGGALVQYIAPRTPEQPAVFRVNSGEQSTMVAVDPYNGAVLGSWERHNALYDLANTIHGTLMIGDIGDRLVEIAAGFGVVLIVTGIYLWWPRDGRSFASAFVPRLSGRGRQLWKSLHQTVGVYIAAILLVFLVSGLTWTGIWGERMTQAWSTFPAEKWDNVPLSDATHASMNHGGVKEVPWTLEQTPMPASGSHAGHQGTSDGQPVDLDNVVALARSIGFDGRFQLSFPSGEKGVWTIARDTMSNDSAKPLSDRTVHIDRYTGKVLADVGFSDYGTAGKVMAVGIAFHEGDMGIWNIALVTAFCLSVIFLSVSGIVMWWKRRPSGAGRLVAPIVPEKAGLWKTGAIVMLAVSLLFPLTGIILVTVLALDMLVIRYVKPLKRALS